MSRLPAAKKAGSRSLQPNIVRTSKGYAARRRPILLGLVRGALPGALLGASLAASGCRDDVTEVISVPITLHELEGCSVPEQIHERGFIELEALGDFDASRKTSLVFRPSELGRALELPVATRSLSARLSGGGDPFWGVGRAEFGAPVDLLLWPEARVCSLLPRQRPSYPALGGGQAIGYSRARDLVLVAGGDAGESAAVVGALTLSLRTGRAKLVDAAARHVLLEPRAFATATEFGEEMLVAGGEDPLSTRPRPARPVLPSAEVFDPDLDRFELEPIRLRVPRTRHAAHVLPDGATLLVGGRGPDGEATKVLEAVAPSTRVSSLGGLTTLEHGRIEPTVFANSRGEIVVIGGYNEAGAPVPEVEWLTADAGGHARASLDLPLRLGQAFVPMPGGGILGVGGCEGIATSMGPPCRQGVPPTTWQGFWLPAQGDPQMFDLTFEAPNPVLVVGESGGPWLLATGAEPTDEIAEAQAQRFDPWGLVFEPTAVLLPRALAGRSVEPGLFLALAETEGQVELYGLRHSLRHGFSRDIALIRTPNASDPRRPRHLAPDRPAGDDTVSYTDALELREGAVALTDAAFLDVRGTLEIASGEPPLIVLEYRDLGRWTFGGKGCSWPSPTPSKTYTAVFERRGAEVSLSHNGKTKRCEAPEGRAELALGASANGAVRLLRWDVERLGAAE